MLCAAEAAAVAQRFPALAVSADERKMPVSAAEVASTEDIERFPYALSCG